MQKYTASCHCWLRVQECGPEQATSSFLDSVSSSGKWGYAQEPGSGCHESGQKRARPSIHHVVCSEVMQAATLSFPKSTPIPEVVHPLSLSFPIWPHSPKELMLLNCGAGGIFLRVPWTARRSNQSILKETNPEYSLEGLMLKPKL